MDLSVCLSACPSIGLPRYLPMSACLAISILVYMSIKLSRKLLVYLSILLSIDVAIPVRMPENQSILEPSYSCLSLCHSHSTRRQVEL